MPPYWTEIEDIQSFDVEFGIYFMTETGFWYFQECDVQLKMYKKGIPAHGRNKFPIQGYKHVFFIYYIFFYVWTS